MDSQFNQSSDENPNRRKSTTRPIVALVLDLLPFAVFYLPFFRGEIFGPSIFVALISMLMGLCTGISALYDGVDVIGRAGKAIAIIAVAIPAALVTFIIIFFIGAATGMISFM